VRYIAPLPAITLDLPLRVIIICANLPGRLLVIGMCSSTFPKGSHTGARLAQGAANKNAAYLPR